MPRCPLSLTVLICHVCSNTLVLRALATEIWPQCYSQGRCLSAHQHFKIPHELHPSGTHAGLKQHYGRAIRHLLVNAVQL